MELGESNNPGEISIQTVSKDYDDPPAYEDDFSQPPEYEEAIRLREIPKSTVVVDT